MDNKRLLTAAFVKGVRHSGKPYGQDKYFDPHGLLLRVIPTGGKQWIWRGTVRGKRIERSLGGWPYASLADARQAGFEHRKLAREGGDPRSIRSGQGAPTFAEAAKTVIGIHEAGWRNGGKNAAQWRVSLRDDAIPKLGELRVSGISTADVMAVLLPIWNQKPETARRVRQRVGAIMKWAVAQGYRPDNWAGDALGAALPKHSGAKRYHQALPHGEAEPQCPVRLVGRGALDEEFRCVRHGPNVRAIACLVKPVAAPAFPVPNLTGASMARNPERPFPRPGIEIPTPFTTGPQHLVWIDGVTGKPRRLSPPASGRRRVGPAQRPGFRRMDP